MYIPKSTVSATVGCLTNSGPSDNASAHTVDLIDLDDPGLREQRSCYPDLLPSELLRSLLIAKLVGILPVEQHVLDVAACLCTLTYALCVRRHVHPRVIGKTHRIGNCSSERLGGAASEQRR